jgi:hypothetical protein
MEAQDARSARATRLSESAFGKNKATCNHNR